MIHRKSHENFRIRASNLFRDHVKMTGMKKPNFLFIMADQFRYDHLSILGKHPVDTPNLDRIAKQGVIFTHCCTNSPVCAAARISLATGLHCERTGALDNGAYVPRSRTTYYQRLRDDDYRVGTVGKLDLGKPDPYNGLKGQRPSVYRWGFTHPMECEGKMHAGRGRPPHGPYTAWLNERGLLDTFCDDYAKRREEDWATSCWDSPLPTDAFEDHFIGQQSVKWLREMPKDFPWHLFVSFVGPHDPFDPPTEYADMFRDAAVLPPIKDSGTPRAPQSAKRQKEYPDEVVQATRRQYAGSIKLIDDQVGEIMNALEERGEIDNTYFFFSSDHGEMLGDLGMYTKGFPYEASMRVPLIAAGPGIEGGHRNESMVELSDLNPTICELAGLPPQEDIDAKSMVPVLRGETDTHREEALSIIRGWRCVRTRTHKLVVYASRDQEFYDLENDPEENDNLAGDGSETMRDLTKRLRQRFLYDARWRY